MFNALGIVEAHTGLEKAARRLGGKPLLEWTVRRLTECQRLDRVVVLTERGPVGDMVAELVPPDVPVVAGSSTDLLSQYLALLDEHPAHAIVRVGADSPFVDPVLVDRLVTTADEHPQCHYIGYCRRDGRPLIQASIGLFAEWMSADALRQVAAEAKDPQLRQRPGQYIAAHPERFNIRLIPAPAGLDRGDVRLAVQSEEDWEHAQTILEALGPEALDWQRITSLLDSQPDLRSRMAVLNRGADKG